MINHIVAPPCRDKYGQFEKGKPHAWEGNTCFECGMIRIKEPGSGQYRYGIEDEQLSEKAYHGLIVDGLASIGKTSIEAYQATKALDRRVENIEHLVYRMEKNLDWIKESMRKK